MFSPINLQFFLKLILLANYPDLNPLFTFAVPGYNVRSTELNAVLGLEQLKRLDYNIEKRRKNLQKNLKKKTKLILCC